MSRRRDDEIAEAFGPPGPMPEPTESDREVVLFLAQQRAATRRGALRLAFKGTAMVAAGGVWLLLSDWVLGRLGVVPIYMVAGSWGLLAVGALLDVSAAIVWLRTWRQA